MIVGDNGIRKGSWSLGRIVELLPGKDGIIRVVKVRTKDVLYTRPVTKLGKLEQNEVPHRAGYVDQNRAYVKSIVAVTRV